MKIAVISDIHANTLALDKVIEDIQSQECDEIWCLGDIAMAGYDPNGAIEKIKYLMSDSSPVKTRSIFGNTDQMLVQYNEELFEKIKAVSPVMAYALQDDVKILKDENREFLLSLPSTKTVEFSAFKFFLCHGSPRKIDEGIYPDTPAPILQEMIKSTDADCIFCGHTHIPCGFQLENGQSVVNAGSVGRPLAEDRNAVWAFLKTIEETEPYQYEIIHRFVEYDNNTASQRIRERGFQECNALADMLLKKE